MSSQVDGGSIFASWVCLATCITSKISIYKGSVELVIDIWLWYMLLIAVAYLYLQFFPDQAADIFFKNWFNNSLQIGVFLSTEVCLTSTMPEYNFHILALLWGFQLWSKQILNILQPRLSMRCQRYATQVDLVQLFADLISTLHTCETYTDRWVNGQYVWFAINSAKSVENMCITCVIRVLIDAGHWK